MALEREALHRFIALSIAEESFKKHKSRVRWLQLGDQNTRFLHRLMACNRMINKILSLCDDNCLRVEDSEEGKRVIVGFYEGM